MKNDGLILKSPYNYPQVRGFISVKQYMMVRVGGKKCVLLRFENELDYSVDSFEYLLIKLDKKGAIIGNTKVRCDAVYLSPGGLYAQGKGIVVEEKCADCRVQVISARSGNYRYTVKDGRTLLAHFDDEEAPSYLTAGDFSLMKPSRQAVKGRSVRTKDKHPRTAITLIAAAAIIALLLIHSMPYIDATMAFFGSRGSASNEAEEQTEEQTEYGLACSYELA